MYIIKENTDFEAAVKAYTALGSQMTYKYRYDPSYKKIIEDELRNSYYTGTVYRGQSFSDKQWEKIYETYFNNGIIQFDSNIVSFTKDKNRTGVYGKGGQVYVRYVLSGKFNGVDISFLSIYPEEQEVLVYGGTHSFKVISCEMTRPGFFLTEIKRL